MRVIHCFAVRMRRIYMVTPMVIKISTALTARPLVANTAEAPIVTHKSAIVTAFTLAGTPLYFNIAPDAASKPPVLQQPPVEPL